ncbi:MAG: alkaline shock response membrane anchor protein AmaP [Clostridiales bacterium]|nr:alkaline shock response membrane anchor protein AmaP [Clostridiales bacterium]
MRITVFDRLLFVLQTILILLIAIAIAGSTIAIGFNVVTLEQIGGVIESIQLDWRFFIIAPLISLLLIILGIRMFYANSRPKTPSGALVKRSEFGMIHVSINTLEAMTQKAVHSFDQIKDLRVNVLTEEDGVRIKLRLSIMPDVILPELTVAIQQKVKDYIESYSGIPVQNVYIYIESLSTMQPRPKVQ